MSDWVNLQTLLAFALGVLLAGWVMSLVGKAKSVATGGGA